MAGNFKMPKYDLPRTSTETDERHLLTASESASIITDGDRTPRAGSPARPAATRHQSIATPQIVSTHGSYRGFSSEAAYLAALRSWAEGRTCTEPTETTLLGYYGSTTMAEYASRPPVLQPLGLRKKWKALKANREAKKNDERRATIA